MQTAAASEMVFGFAGDINFAENWYTYALFLTYVLRNKNPLGCVILLLPRLEVTQGVLVSFGKRGGVRRLTPFHAILHPLGLQSTARRI